MTKTESTSETVDEPPIVWIHPRAWKANNRTRMYLTLTERNYSREADFDMMRRSVQRMLKRQDRRGSFYSDEELREGDKVDDHLGAACLVAYHLFRLGPDPAMQDALERAVRFHLDHLAFHSIDGSYAHSRFYNDRDSSGDWCNTLWTTGNGSTLLRYGRAFLSEGTASELRELLGKYWRFLSNYSIRDENPCHNQLLAYCEIGILCATTIGDEAVKQELMEYYHRHLRRLRIRDRGHSIYAEFNQWDVHYGVLSWIILEYLHVETGDPAFAEDADEMAYYFNEWVSAGGYYWGGSRNNECGVDEFPHLFTARDAELGFSRLLFPEPSQFWRQMTVDGHGGSGLTRRLEIVLPGRKTPRPQAPAPWHFQTGDVSVCLLDDTRMHHVSAAGLELISVASVSGFLGGLRWLNNGVWKEDALQSHVPKTSEGLSFYDSKPIQAGAVTGVASMQRGYFWETRQWWLSSGNGLIWIGQLTTHAFPKCDEVDFVLGNPVITRLAGRHVPVADVQTEDGTLADTQGDAVSVTSPNWLRFGEIFVGATAPLEFVRPSSEAFHTFPIPLGTLWRDFTSSNELRLRVLDTPRQLESRESLFFAVEIGADAPALEASGDPQNWTLKSRVGTLEARQTDGVWRYTLETASTVAELPYVGFGYRG